MNKRTRRFLSESVGDIWKVSIVAGMVYNKMFLWAGVYAVGLVLNNFLWEEPWRSDE